MKLISQSWNRYFTDKYWFIYLKNHKKTNIVKNIKYPENYFFSTDLHTLIITIKYIEIRVYVPLTQCCWIIIWAINIHNRFSCVPTTTCARNSRHVPQQRTWNVFTCFKKKKSMFSTIWTITNYIHLYSSDFCTFLPAWFHFRFSVFLAFDGYPRVCIYCVCEI